MRIAPENHLRHPWKVHSLLSDFKIEDVWQLPVVLQTNHSLALLHNQFSQVIEQTQHRGIPGMLFQFRLFLGRVFKWDEKEEQTALIPGSIRERHATKESLSFHDLPEPSNGSFIPVYKLDEEVLSEIDNETVHAALHFSRVPLNRNQFTVHMTIYVKPKGAFGRMYMLLIKPFRRLIIYPAMLRAIEKSWKNYLQKQEPEPALSA